MGASLREIKRRIGSVKSTQKITRAMKMVAASRLRKMQQATLKSRVYSEHLEGIVYNIAQRGGEDVHPLMKPRENIKNVDLLVITSDRGLCGSINENLLRRVLKTLDEQKADGKEATLTLLGRKGKVFFDSKGVPVKDFIANWSESLSLDVARKLADVFTTKYLNHETDQVISIYNFFKSAGSQEIVYSTLLPASMVSNGPLYTIDYIYEPSRGILLEELVREELVAAIYQMLCESYTSELAARLLAMDKATRNADDMIRTLTGRYNRSRQAAITLELLDIITGVEAMA